jgi:hypothetical protein
MFFAAAGFVRAQSGNENWDLETIFDEPADEDIAKNETAVPQKKEPSGTKATDNVTKLLRRTGFSFTASISMLGGVSFGWQETPWNWGDGYDVWDGLDAAAGVDMSGGLGLDFQFSDVLRVKNKFQFTFPYYTFNVTEFFIDYNMYNRVFFRAGKTNVTWGQARNYEFTNLPARIPAGNKGGDSVIVKADIPIGIGGLQLLGLVRPGFLNPKNPTIPGMGDIGYGLKFNLSLRLLDADMGLFFHKAMPLRSFVSLKTTIADFEVYADALYVYQYNQDLPMEWYEQHQGAFGFGLLRDCFDKKLTVNVEAFYNADKDSAYWQKQGELVKEDTMNYIEGWNGSINVVVRPIDYKNFRIFSRCLYSFETYSAWLVPGISIEPLAHITTYLAVPAALGPRDGPYYIKNSDIRNRPFSIVIGLKLSGNYGFRHYEQ